MNVREKCGSVSVVEASAEEAFIFNNLGELYVHDFSEIVPSELNETGPAAALFGLRHGPWEVRERAGNAAAHAFWRSAIGVYTSGHFDEVLVEDERWHGWVQRFVS